MTRSETATPKTLIEALEIQARERPEASAFIETNERGRDEVTTYGDSLRKVEEIAARLKSAGVQPGDRVAVRLSKSVASMLLFFAVTRAGAVYVPINPDFTERESSVLIEDSMPVLLIDNSGCNTSLPHEIRNFSFGTNQSNDLLAIEPTSLPPSPDAQSGATMLFTSGTTGRPKGAPLTHENLLSNVLALADAWGISHKDRLLHVLPVFHGHGLFLGIAMMIVRGATVRLLPKYEAEATLRYLPEATVFMAVPAIYTSLLEHKDFTQKVCRKLRLATSGSAPLSPELFEALRFRMGILVVERYGLTETCILTTNPIDGSARVGSVGCPLSCVELRITNDENVALESGQAGRVQVRGPSVIEGYWRRPERKEDWTSDGWFDTGDLGQKDEDGYLWLVGRKKDLIITGGFNVYPREIEIELEALEGVAEAVVFGVPHPDFGEGVMAAVRPESDKMVNLKSLESALGEKLAKYKRPKRIIILEDFPRNQMGKVLKTDLRESYANEFVKTP